MPGTGDVLISRAEAMRRLDCGRAMIFKLEKDGKLHKVRLTASPKGHVFYRLSDVEALMQPEVEPQPPVVPLKRRRMHRSRKPPNDDAR